MMKKLSFPRRLGIRALDAYKKWVSPILPPSCRYHPTCSEYCREAVTHYGLIRGTWMGFCRVLRCNPLFRGGYDPPRTRAERKQARMRSETLE